VNTDPRSASRQTNPVQGTPPPIQLRWVRFADDQVYRGIEALFRSVVERGGAIGFIEPPSFAETREWVSEVLADVVAGDAGLALVVNADEGVRAMGCWRRERSAVFRKVAGLHKVASHPASRGLGFGRAVVQALVEDATREGVEVVSLGTRGNNHTAIGLYRSLGFTEWGRLPNSIAIGHERYDDVRMFVSVQSSAETMSG
jgi:ribosomal protein S18 acetylase RimI-like enzyme